LDARLVESVRAVAEEFLADQQRLLDVYIQVEGQEDTDRENLTQLPFMPNLRGGRFEVNLPAEPLFDTVVSHIAQSAAPRILSKAWGSQAELLVFLLMSQAGATWDQAYHKDSDTVEEAKIQIALQNYDSGDGPPEFLLGSHLVVACRELSQANRSELFQVSLRAPAQAGDAVVYFSGVDHRGRANTAQRLQRRSLDVTLHSSGRYFYDSERKDTHVRPHVGDRDANLRMRALWRARREGSGQGSWMGDG